MNHNQVRIVFHIFVLIVVVAIFSIVNFSSNKESNHLGIVLSGNDTLGRNWNAISNISEAQIIQNNSNTSTSYSSSDKTETSESYTYEPTDFSNNIYKEETQTVIVADGREVVTGTN